MGLKKYRFDKAQEPCPNGSVGMYSERMGGPTLAGVRNCPTPFGNRTVYVQGEPDTYFSIPAKCRFKGKVIRGYIGSGEEGYYFQPYKGEQA